MTKEPEAEQAVCAENNSVCATLVGASEAYGDEQQDAISEMLMRQAFPELNPDDEAVGLGESVYLCFAAFCPSDGTMLSHRGVLP